VPIAELRNVALDEAQGLAIEFRDLLFKAPVQLQADMLFSMRAVGLLAGMATSLDPDFDPWSETMPYAQRFALEERLGRWREWLDDIGSLVHRLLTVPAQLDHLMARFGEGAVQVETSLSAEARQRLEWAERSLDRLSWMVAGGALLVSGIVLRAADLQDPLAPWLMGGAATAALIGMLRRWRRPRS